MSVIGSAQGSWMQLKGVEVLGETSWKRHHIAGDKRLSRKGLFFLPL